MLDLKQSTPRRSFLGSLAAGAAALGLAAVTSPFNLSAKPKSHPQPSDDAGFEGWLGKIKGKHRQVFDTPMPNGGFAFAWARVFLMTNKQVGVADNDMTSVIVLRHDAIPFAMDHSLWSKYKFGEVFKITDKATNAPAVRNTHYQPKAGELLLPDMSIEELTKSDVLIGVCDVALTVYSSMVAKTMNADAAEVKKDWVAGILPGIQIVPSGVLAVNRAQEHSCTYCFAG
jgi:intracellular sulfur oxidation DsrE/DsrF family protein